ncbi:MAG: hypothetical protein REI45_15770, partial [Propionicimonas sp.]|nr:hypothetical protein [Propionicimonas sp.]
MTAATLALVESPVQLLHTLEWCHSTGAAADTMVAVLAPRDEASRRQLRAMLGFADEEGIDATWFDPRRPAELPGALVRLRRAVSRADRLLVGDPFSGLIRALLPVARAGDVVVLDDGTATIDFTARLADRRPLARWDARPGGLGGRLRDRLGSHAGAFYAPGNGRRVSTFTVMPGTSLPGLVRQQNGYEWTRRRFSHPEVVGGTDVVGSSLVESGVVDEAAYLAVVHALAASRGVG